MPRIGSRIQTGGIGSYNPANPGRAITPAIRPKGPVLPVEQFVDEKVDPSVRRALNNLQANVAQAIGQVKGSSFAYSNICSGVKLTNGGANGASPNLVAHGLTVSPSGYAILFTRGGYVTAEALILPAPNKNLIQIWTQITLFAGSAGVLADILVYA